MVWAYTPNLTWNWEGDRRLGKNGWDEMMSGSGSTGIVTHPGMKQEAAVPPHWVSI